jgi:hypothetical protein
MISKKKTPPAALFLGDKLTWPGLDANTVIQVGRSR